MNACDTSRWYTGKCFSLGTAVIILTGATAGVRGVVSVQSMLPLDWNPSPLLIAKTSSSHNTPARPLCKCAPILRRQYYGFGGLYTEGSRGERKHSTAPRDARTFVNPTCNASARLVKLYSNYVCDFVLFCLVAVVSRCLSPCDIP